MYRRTLLSMGAASLLAACAGPTGTALTRDERRALRIAAFAVVVDGADLRNGGPEFRNRIVQDLAAEMRSEFSDVIDPSGWTMQAEISVLDVVGGTSTALGRGQSELTGTLRLVDTSGALRASLPITVTAGAARESLGGQAVGAITGGRSGFYNDLVESFAREARVLTLGDDLPGERLVRQARNL